MFGREQIRQRTRREHILDVISDAVADILYYDRKEDEDLSVGAIEEAIEEGEITAKEIVNLFEAELSKGLK